MTPTDTTTKLADLFKDAIDWARSYGSRLSLSDITVTDVTASYADKAAALLRANAAVVPRPMETAPRDGTIVRLLVQFEDHPLEDDNTKPLWTIGGNTSANTGVDHGWQFAGWNWSHDHFTEGVGAPVGWLPLVDAAPSAPVLAEPDDEDDGDLTGVAGPLPEHGWDEVPAAKSPTAGMTLVQRILHVGGRNNAAGYVEFGSTQAVDALIGHVLRDLPAHQQPAQGIVPTLRSALNAMLTFFGMDEDENSKAVFDRARKAEALARSWVEQPVQGGGDAEHLPLAVNSAPAVIWLDLGFNPSEEDAHFSNLAGVTWSEDNPTDHGIKYVRADTLAIPPAQPAPQAQGVELATDPEVTEAVANGFWTMFPDATPPEPVAQCFHKFLHFGDQVRRRCVDCNVVEPVAQLEALPVQGDDFKRADFEAWVTDEAGPDAVKRWPAPDAPGYENGRVQDYRTGWVECLRRAPLPTSGVPILFASPEQLQGAVAGTLQGFRNLPESTGGYLPVRTSAGGQFTAPLYAAPQPAAARVGLSAEQIAQLWAFGWTGDRVKFVRAIESAHGIASPQEDGGTAA